MEELAEVSFPSDREIVLKQWLDAPNELVWEVLTQTEHQRHLVAPFDEEVTVCEADLRVGGRWHNVFVPKDGAPCSFWGNFLEVDAPNFISETWHFEGWGELEAIQSSRLEAQNGGTLLTDTMTFKTAAERDFMPSTDGLEGNFAKLIAYLAEIQK